MVLTNHHSSTSDTPAPCATGNEIRLQCFRPDTAKDRLCQDWSVSGIQILGRCEAESLTVPGSSGSQQISAVNLLQIVYCSVTIAVSISLGLLGFHGEQFISLTHLRILRYDVNLLEHSNIYTFHINFPPGLNQLPWLLPSCESLLDFLGHQGSGRLAIQALQALCQAAAGAAAHAGDADIADQSTDGLGW